MKLLFLLFTTTLFAQTNINDIGEFNFNDFATYTKFRANTTLTSGLNVTTLGNEFINTNKFIDSSVYSVTITGTCTQNNTSHFGFGIKNGANFSSILYRGSNGNVEELLYNSTTLKTPVYRTGGATYVVGDVVSVKVYFQQNQILFKTAKNGVWSSETHTAKSFLNSGELVIVIRSASSWSNISAKIDTSNVYNNCYISPIGNDANDGNFETPVKTIARAKDITKGIGVITAKSGVYYDDYTFDMKRSFNLVGSENVRFVYGERINNATLVGGVYEFTYLPLNGTVTAQKLWIDGIVHNRITNYQLNYTSNLATVTSGWNQANGKIYVKVPFALDLSINNIVLPSRGNFTNQYHYAIGGGLSSSNVNIQNISLNYAPLQLYNTTFSLINVKAGCVASKAVFEIGYNLNSYLQDCEAYGANFTTAGFGDGFSLTANNYLANEYNTYVTFINCYAHDNQDDGFTNHGGTYMLIKDSLSEYNGNGITPASGGDCSINNTIVRYNANCGISVVGSPLDGSPTTECVVNFTECKNNLNNYYIFNHTNLVMIVNECISIQGVGTHYSTGVVQNNCITQNN